MMATLSSKEQSQHWSLYWAQGHTTTFREQFDDGYDRGVQQFWQQALDGLPDDAAILDIGTGNGGLLKLINEMAKTPYRLTGIDSADIRPWFSDTEDQAPSNITFIGKTPAEKLPLEDQSVDLAVSQFGLEYSDLNQSLPELARTLKPGSNLVAMLHHKGSEVSQDTFETLEAIEFCHHQLHLIQKTQALAFVRMNDPDNEIHQSRLRRSANRAVSQIEMQAAQATPGFQRFASFYVASCMSIFQHKSIVENPIDQLQKVLGEVLAYEARLKDMTHAALDENKSEQFAESLKSAGFSGIELEPFHFREQPFAYTLRARLTD